MGRKMTTTHRVTGIGCLVLLLIWAFLSGPRVEMDTQLHPVAFPKNIDQYLTTSESVFDDIVPGTEKTIIWAGKAGVPTSVSLVYLHGFSASRQETAPLSEILAKRLGANLFYTRFTGHGRTGAAMLDGSVNAWLNDALEALKIGQQLGKKVILIGTSTGGTAATWLAAQPETTHVAALILISPNFGPADSMSRLLLWPWGRQMAELIIGKERCWEPENPRQKKYWTHCYPTKSLLPMMGLVSLTNALDLADIKTPVLVLYSPRDRVVNAASIESTFARFGSVRKRIIPYTDADDPSQHVLAGDILSQNSTEALGEMIVEFITREVDGQRSHLKSRRIKRPDSDR